MVIYAADEHTKQKNTKTKSIHIFSEREHGRTTTTTKIEKKRNVNSISMTRG